MDNNLECDHFVREKRIPVVKRQEKNLALWKELTQRRFLLQSDATTPNEEKRRLLVEIVDLSRRARDGGVPRDDWENHELNWTAYCAGARRRVMRSLAQALIDCEVHYEPAGLNHEMRKILYWWQCEGGREELLGELPIEERHALEAAARRN